MQPRASDHVSVSDHATVNASYVRTAHDHVPVSDHATANASYMRTAHDHVPVSDHAAVNVLVNVAGARVLAAPAGPTVTVRRRPSSPIPQVDLELAKDQWDMTTVGVGVTVGAVVGHVPGTIIGGVVAGPGTMALATDAPLTDRRQARGLTRSGDAETAAESRTSSHLPRINGSN